MIHIDMKKGEGLLNGKNIEENWEIKNLALPEVEKFEKYKNEVKINYDSEVVICQSSLTIIKYIYSFASYAFYFPLTSTVETSVNEMFFLTEFYVNMQHNVDLLYLYGFRLFSLEKCYLLIVLNPRAQILPEKNLCFVFRTVQFSQKLQKKE